MAQKVNIGVMFFITLVTIHMSAPISMLDYYMSWFTELQCSMPKDVQSVNLPEDDTIFGLPLNICRNITNSEDKKLELFTLCREVFDNLYAILNCDSSKKSKRNAGNDPISFPFSENDVCAVFRKQDKESLLETPYFVKMQNKEFCDNLCATYADLCKSLLWTVKVKRILALKSSRTVLDNATTLLSNMQNNSMIENQSLTNGNKSSDVKLVNETTVELVKPPKTQPASIIQKFTIKLQKDLHSDESPSMNKNSEDKKTDLEKKTIKPDVKKDDSNNEKNDATHTQSNTFKISLLANSNSASEELVSKEKGNKNKVSLKEAIQFTTLKDSIHPDSVTKNSINLDLSEVTKSISQNSIPVDNPDFEEANENLQEYVYVPSQEYSSKDKMSSSINNERSKNAHTDSRHLPQLDSSDYDKELPNAFLQPDDSHFFLYFLFVVVIIIGCYVLFHNKQKIIALIVEGRHERRRRPNGVSYRKLETKT